MADTPIIKTRIQEDLKTAMRAQDKRRVGTLRLVMAAVKQREVDERIVVDDVALFGILEKMLKQRRESIAQYQKAAREDLLEQETYEVGVIQGYLPAALDASELDSLVDAAIQQIGASSIKDMGKVMAILRDQVQGRAEMGAVSARVKAHLPAR